MRSLWTNVTMLDEQGIRHIVWSYEFYPCGESVVEGKW